MGKYTSVSRIPGSRVNFGLGFVPGSVAGYTRVPRSLGGIHPNIEGAVNVTANPRDGTESLVEMAAAADRCDSPELSDTYAPSERDPY